VAPYFEGGQCISYGARVLNSGGYHSYPHPAFPGGMLIGCSAGYINVAKIKGAHNAMKSGMLAAEATFESLDRGDAEGNKLTDYVRKLIASPVKEELEKVRNFKQGFSKNLWFGLIHGFITSFTNGKEPWTLKKKTPDS
jgi:electron-transferring-flavoprotein dehydrogenase